MENTEIFSFFSSEFYYLHIAYVFLFGLIFGSFFNVCIYRIPLGMSIVKPGSHCFNCNYFLKWYDNIPLLSYLLLRGKCRKCGAIYSVRYFLVELLTGILFTIVFLKYNYSWATLVYIIVTSLLIIITFTDIDHWIIPDSINLGGFIFGVLVALIIPFLGNDFYISTFGPIKEKMYFTPLLNCLAGAGAGFLLFYLIGFFGSLAFKKEAMGGGDIKLMTFVGAFVGHINIFLIMMIASLLGVLIAISTFGASKIYKLLHKKEEVSQKPSLYHHIPFGPYLAVSTYIILVWGHEIVAWIEKTLFYPMKLI